MKLRITEAKLKEMDELTPLGKTDIGDLWDMRQDWVEMKKAVERLSARLDAEIKFHENTCFKYYAERSDLREENERLEQRIKDLEKSRNKWRQDEKELNIINAELNGEVVGYIEENDRLREENERLRTALKVIDIHIRSTHNPIPYIIHDLKEVLYKEGTE